MASIFKQQDESADGAVVGVGLDDSDYARPAIKESNTEGAAKRAAISPEDYAAKGNLGMENIPGFDPRPLSSENPPWKGLSPRK